MTNYRNRMAVVFLAVVLLGLSSGSAQAGAQDDTYAGLRLDNLPSVSQVIDAAMETLPRDLAKVTDWNSRMRWSTLLPQFQVRYRLFEDVLDRYETVYRTTTDQRTVRRNEDRDTDRDTDTLSDHVATDPFDSYVDTTEQDYDEDYSSSFTERYSGVERSGPWANNRDDELVWAEEINFQATWNLSQLVYSDDEIQAAAANRFVAEFRIKYMESVAKIYAALRSALETLDRTPDNARARSQRDIHAAMLDQLTDGYLLDTLPSSSARSETATAQMMGESSTPVALTSPESEVNDEELSMMEDRTRENAPAAMEDEESTDQEEEEEEEESL